jgi:hypothetical protein
MKDNRILELISERRVHLVDMHLPIIRIQVEHIHFIVYTAHQDLMLLSLRPLVLIIHIAQIPKDVLQILVVVVLGKGELHWALLEK